MKKLKKLKSRSKKLWLRKLKSKYKRCIRRKKNQGKKKKELETERYLKHHWDIVKVIAPKNFSFVDNTNTVAKFISKLSDCYDNKKKVFVVLKNIENLSYDALVVLLSIMVKFKAKKISFNGDMPQNKAACERLKKSGFFHYLYFGDVRESDSYVIGEKNRIHTHAMKNVDPVLGDKLIRGASKTVWGNVRRCQGVQKTFMELMLNTNNHADIEQEGVKHWWLSVFHIPEEKKVAFSFVDFGVGIFNSLEKKTERSKWYGWAQKLANLVNFDNNADLLKHILDGKLHTTITKEKYRGTGLPGIRLALTRNQISNLHIVTNNVKADVKNDNYEIITQNFNGTFVYWELNENNVSCDGNA